MRTLVIQIKDRFEKPVNTTNVEVMDFPQSVELGYEFWSNNTLDDNKSGLYRVIEVM